MIIRIISQIAFLSAFIITTQAQSTVIRQGWKYNKICDESIVYGSSAQSRAQEERDKLYKEFVDKCLVAKSRLEIFGEGAQGALSGLQLINSGFTLVNNIANIQNNRYERVFNQAQFKAQLAQINQTAYINQLQWPTKLWEAQLDIRKRQVQGQLEIAITQQKEALLKNPEELKKIATQMIIQEAQATGQQQQAPIPDQQQVQP